MPAISSINICQPVGDRLLLSKFRTADRAIHPFQRAVPAMAAIVVATRIFDQCESAAPNRSRARQVWAGMRSQSSKAGSRSAGEIENSNSVAVRSSDRKGCHEKTRPGPLLHPACPAALSSQCPSPRHRCISNIDLAAKLSNDDLPVANPENLLPSQEPSVMKGIGRTAKSICNVAGNHSRMNRRTLSPRDGRHMLFRQRKLVFGSDAQRIAHAAGQVVEVIPQRDRQDRHRERVDNKIPGGHLEKSKPPRHCAHADAITDKRSPGQYKTNERSPDHGVEAFLHCGGKKLVRGGEDHIGSPASQEQQHGAANPHFKKTPILGGLHLRLAEPLRSPGSYGHPKSSKRKHADYCVVPIDKAAN